MKRLHIYTILLGCFLVLSHLASAQYKIRGTVYDSTYMKPLIAVSVLSTGGKGAVTNDKGQYEIEVGERDSIWFSYLDKPTRKYPVLKIYDVTRFDIALQTYNQVLDEVTIRKRSYRMDSIQNRIDYAKIFNFRKPNLESMTSIGPTGAGIDIQELIRLFQFRKNKATLKFQERLLLQERDKFVDHKFNKGLVRLLTGLEGEELETFMQIYRPTPEFIISHTEYEFQAYIKQAFAEYKSKKAF